MSCAAVEERRAEAGPSRSLRRSARTARRSRISGLGVVLLLGGLGPAAAGPALAQEEVPDFVTLRTPESPAFVVLGIAPAAVSRPTAPVPFAAGLLDHLSGGGGLLPSSFALEVAPYWWVPHPDLELEEYERHGAGNLLRSLSLSVAVTDSVGPGGDEAGLRRLGVGVRTSLVPGRTVTRACLDRARAAAVRASRPVASGVAAAVAADPSLVDDPDRLEVLRDSLYREGVAALEPEERALLTGGSEEHRSCVAELSAREGFLLDVAAAGALRFPEGRAEAGDWSSASLWLTPAWSDARLTAAFVARLGWDGLDSPGGATTTDLGVRGLYARERYAGSLEAVWRHRNPEAGPGEDLYRLALVVEAGVAGNDWLTLSVGRDFDANAPDSFFGAVGLQLQVGERTVRPPGPVSAGEG